MPINLKIAQRKIKTMFCAAGMVCAVICFLPQRAAANEPISALRLSGLSWEDVSPEVTRLKILADGIKASKLESLVDPEEAGRRLMDFFILGLNVRGEKFWANLTPGEPDNIVDPELAATALGEIMLRADLRLKKDFCEVTNPQLSLAGKKYWDALSDKAARLGIKKMPAMNRIWIVPDEAVVHETANGAYISESRLKVCLKANYSADIAGEPGAKVYSELSNYAGQLLKDIILPELDKRVNQSFFYADLRQVNQALILARWYKKKFGAGKEFSLPDRSARAALLEVEPGLLKRQIYDDYMDSLSNGEYAITGPSGWSSALDYLRPKKRYVSGGVDLRKSPVRAGQSTPASKQGKNARYAFSMDIYAHAGRYSEYSNDAARSGNSPEAINELTQDMPEISIPKNRRDTETDINKDVISDTVLYSL